MGSFRELHLQEDIDVHEPLIMLKDFGGRELKSRGPCFQALAMEVKLMIFIYLRHRNLMRFLTEYCG